MFQVKRFEASVGEPQAQAHGVFVLAPGLGDVGRPDLFQQPLLQEAAPHRVTGGGRQLRRHDRETAIAFGGLAQKDQRSVGQLGNGASPCRAPGNQGSLLD